MDHHKGCLGTGDREGRLLPTRIRGELESREVVQVRRREGARGGRAGAEKREGEGRSCSCYHTKINKKQETLMLLRKLDVCFISLALCSLHHPTRRSHVAGTTPRR